MRKQARRPTDDDVDPSILREVPVRPDAKLTPKEIDVVLGNFTERFDAKMVLAFKTKFNLAQSMRREGQSTYLEELFMPRYCSPQRLVVSPLLFSIMNGVFGASYAIWTNQNKPKTMLRYFGGGLLLGIPYYLCNEVITGMLIRSTGREQYFFSHTASGLLMLVGYFGIQAARKSSSRRF